MSGTPDTGGTWSPALASGSGIFDPAVDTAGVYTYTHVGIIMKDNYIIHAHGKVRIDRLDHSGIYNVDQKLHTHKLRVIKKII